MFSEKHNFIIGPTDTDSISFGKQDGSPFSEEEIKSLLKDINEISPEFMIWEDDGYFEKIIALRAKNYILYDGDTIKLKGSGLKSSTLEPKVKEMLNKMIYCLVHDKKDQLPIIYNEYIKEASNIIDIKPWAKKMTLSATTYASERTNETKLIDAIKGSEYKEGDRIYVYFKEDDSLGLAEQYNGCYNKNKIYEKLYKAVGRFETILPIKELFVNYKLVKSRQKLEELLTS